MLKILKALYPVIIYYYKDNEILHLDFFFFFLDVIGDEAALLVLTRTF